MTPRRPRPRTRKGELRKAARHFRRGMRFAEESRRHPAGSMNRSVWESLAAREFSKAAAATGQAYAFTQGWRDG